MFLLEVNVNGVTKSHYWLNKHGDDFLQFMPKHFTAEYGEIITKDDITAYKISEDMKPLLEGKLKKHEDNKIAYAKGKILVKRLDKATCKVGEKIKLEDYEARILARKEKFKDAKVKIKTKVPTYKKEDFVMGTDEETGDDIIENVDVVTVTATDDLAKDVESLELELVGQALAAWPYDSKGKFLGNK